MAHGRWWFVVIWVLLPGCSLWVRSSLEEGARGEDAGGTMDGGREGSVDGAMDGGREGSVDGAMDGGREGSVDGAPDAAGDAAPDAPPDAPGCPDWDPGDTMPRNCHEILERLPCASSGRYRILDPYGFDPDTSTVEVHCDMETEGGGWTLCASAAAQPDDMPPALSHYGWPTSTQDTAWFACDLFVDDGDELMVVSEALDPLSGTPYRYVDRFEGVVLDPGMNSISSTDGEVTLIVHVDSAYCDIPSMGNHAWRLQSGVADRYGIMPRNDCPGGGSRWWFINAPGTVSTGCADPTQIVPFIGYPCGNYGPRAARMELWYRPGPRSAPMGPGSG